MSEHMSRNQFRKVAADVLFVVGAYTGIGVASGIAVDGLRGGLTNVDFVAPLEGRIGERRQTIANQEEHMQELDAANTQIERELGEVCVAALEPYRHTGDLEVEPSDIAFDIAADPSKPCGEILDVRQHVQPWAENEEDIRNAKDVIAETNSELRKLEAENDADNAFDGWIPGLIGGLAIGTGRYLRKRWQTIKLGWSFERSL